MITLLTATPGSGKTLWAVQEIFKRANDTTKDWNIFSNIDGLKLDSAQPLKDKFVDYPPNSLVVIDEAHFITHFSKKYKHPIKNENHPEVEFLSVHRHAEFLDIIFITQAPRRLNVDVLDMVGTHIHLHRPMGMKLATWWLWKHSQISPNTKSAKAEAEDTGTFTYPKQLFTMYKSSDGSGDSHSKIKIPAKVIQGIWMLFLVIAACVYFNWDNIFHKKPTTTTTTTTTHVANTTQPNTNTAPINASDLSIQCRKAENLNRKECIAWYDDLTKNHKSVSTFNYDPSNPFSDDLQKQVQSTYEIKNKPIFSGCLKSGHKYIAYTQQGTILHNVSSSDCERVINGDRPFDYFGDHASKDLSVNAVPASVVPSDDQKVKTVYENKEGI
ncbi:zonular occludens toxin domain-containing protein [Acinetobacter nectaris]|uniref:zonular occludens toxin domain-containing protein n=1 Tax=Acinetobacter nectaris TaxID=1219382 RepID=UPI001F25F160|nr:zonular occludens toxin domain-containing protein [Acinetobacter nectaris]MCF9045649.1 hypothetical protein [Acinetobacter nectaris]